MNHDDALKLAHEYLDVPTHETRVVISHHRFQILAKTVINMGEEVERLEKEKWTVSNECLNKAHEFNKLLKLSEAQHEELTRLREAVREATDLIRRYAGMSYNNIGCTEWLEKYGQGE